MMKGLTIFENRSENHKGFEEKSQIDSKETVVDGSFDLFD